MTSIVVADGPVPAGSPIDRADTRLVSIHDSDEAMTSGLLSPAQVARGWVAAVPVRAGEPITASEVRKASAGPLLGQMSIAVPVQQAAGGSIGPGDLVDVIAANGQGGASYVAQGLRVLSVAPLSSASGVLGGGTVNYFVVVAVDKQVALRIAAALGGQGAEGTENQIEIVRSTGEAPTLQVNYPEGATPSGPPGRRTS